MYFQSRNKNYRLDFIYNTKRLFVLISILIIFGSVVSIYKYKNRTYKSNRDLKSKIQDIVLELKEKHIPVFIREVGFGVSKKSAQDLLDFKNLAGIDCGGSGGTSWSKVESLCSEDERKKNIAQTFAEWGVPTAQSILNIKEAELENKNRGLNLIATGGIRNGLDLAKAIYLGADIGAMARPFLVAANNSKEDLENLIEDTIQELKIAMFACGAKKLADFKSLHKS